MTPMCDVTTGAHVGWAVGITTCDGVVSLEYFDEDGASQGTTLPVDWKPCVQGLTGPEWIPTHTTTPYAASVDIDFAGAQYVSITDVAGVLELTGSNYSSAKEIKVRLVESGSGDQALTFPAGWTFVGALGKPATLPPLSTMLLTLISFGADEANVIARAEVFEP